MPSLVRADKDSMSDRFLRIILADPELVELEFEQIVHDAPQPSVKTDVLLRHLRSVSWHSPEDRKNEHGSEEASTPLASERSPPARRLPKSTPSHN